MTVKDLNKKVDDLTSKFDRLLNAIEQNNAPATKARAKANATSSDLSTKWRKFLQRKGLTETAKPARIARGVYIARAEKDDVSMIYLLGIVKSRFIGHTPETWKALLSIAPAIGKAIE